MTIVISSQNKEQEFKNQNLVVVGTTEDCDYRIKLDYELKISVKMVICFDEQILCENCIKTDEYDIKMDLIV